MKSKLKFIGNFVLFLSAQFTRHGGMQHAGALTYTSLLSLVPLMTVVFSVFAAFPVADQVSKTVEDFVFQNFVPATGEVMQAYVSNFTEKASNLSGTGMVFLVVVALMMMSNIDRVFNQIWEVQAKRKVLAKFLIYWAVLSLGPLLMGSSVLITSYLVSLPFLSDAAASGLGRRFLGLTPMAASSLAFVLMYMVIPNRRVYFRHAVAGGLAAAILFEFAKKAFAVYVTTFPTYEAIYGALATIPIFLVWVYLSWVIVLVGAEFTHCLSIYRWGETQQRSAPLGLLDAINVLILLHKAANQGEGLSLHGLSRAHLGWRETNLEALLQQLKAAKLVHLTQESRWVLARPLTGLTAHDVYCSKPFTLPSDAEPLWQENSELATMFASVNAGVVEGLGRPLSEFV